MATFIALLRGINVGKAKRIPMANLRALLEELGYTNVATLLNSGNAVFSATKGTPAQHAQNIAAAITKTSKLDVPVIVKSAKELAAIIADNSLASDAVNPSQLLTIFSQEPEGLSRLDVVKELTVQPEKFLIGKHAAYLHCASGILKSKAAEALLGKSGKLVTTRNWATVLKLHALANK